MPEIYNLYTSADTWYPPCQYSARPVLQPSSLLVSVAFCLQSGHQQVHCLVIWTEVKRLGQSRALHCLPIQKLVHLGPLFYSTVLKMADYLQNMDTQHGKPQTSLKPKSQHAKLIVTVGFQIQCAEEHSQNNSEHITVLIQPDYTVDLNQI